MSEPTALSLIPPIVVLVFAIWLRRPILALIIGAVTGLLLVDPTEVLNSFADASLKVMGDETIGWLILVCGSFGALIALLVRTGGALAFGRNAMRFATGPRSSLLMTFVLGIVIFIDDYLNALTVGETMKRVTDRFKISREMLAYIVDSTAAPVCVIVPLSTWAVFFGGLLVDNGVAAKGEGIHVYMQAIPYMLYAWLAVLMVLLVAAGIVPAIGPMKKAELAAKAGTPAKAQVDLDEVLTSDEYALKAIEEEFENADKQGKLHNFLVPMLLLVAFTVYFDIDVWKGLLATLVVTIPYYAVQRLMPLAEMMDQMIDGFKSMLPAIGTVIAAFVFKDVCDQLMLPQYVINVLSPYMTAQMLPALVFAAMAILAFATGSSWGIFAVTIPIVMPLAKSVDADIPLVIGALLSASSFGSQACFYSDSTVLAAQGSGCNLVSHAVTQLPYALIAAVIAFFGFILIA
ncbi:Na+/H+ antiporter NhaC family protein [Shewanella fodinae]|jgi:Na+/H+ antiporter NhaC|uniref:Transporter (NhaC family) n=1 Tax=Shewanella fodinae TaxID=552357 RepID=A0A4R2F815_9GAMM|nr:Na+/H+ antiporter NhaC family protein [Shewanella fodinae]MDN5369076.1 tetracycline resistance efflux pump [Shewanella sp.]TCN83331.1 transporter (NhaC family) [Shewanella fodinae]